MNSVRDIDSLYNFIGYVLIYAPDRFPKRDFRPPDQQINLDRAFDELRAGTRFIDPEVADEAKQKTLASLLDQSLEAYRKGDEVKGAHLLQDFQDLIFKAES